MSSEPVKSIEIDCPISPYSQHHNHHQQHHPHHLHHHVLPCHHHHNHHGKPRLEVSSRIQLGDEKNNVEEEGCEGDHQNEVNADEIEKIRCLAQNKLNDCNDRIRCKSTHSRHQTIEQEEPNINDLTGGFLTGGCSSLTNGQVSISDSSYELANSTIASSTSTSPTSLQSSSESSSSIEDGDDEDEDDEPEESDDEERVDDDEEDEEDEDVASSDEEDELEENDDDSEDEDCEDIVDPVGNHHCQSNIDCNSAFTLKSTEFNGITRATNPIVDQIEESISDDHEDDDVSFDENDSDETSGHHTPKQSTNDSSADLLNSERMLEVTRKLVRSTERDPDRDLRKQVLLKTAIRKLPHFMEYNHYSDSFDQSFQLHSSNMNCNNNDSSNVTVNCLSTAQYYEHHHLHMNHHLDSQPKSYYHSVQPNAIQMSTTSLRMLDLNDDQDSETNTLIDTEHQQHQSLNHHLNDYGACNDIQGKLQTSLESQQQQPHDYANHPEQPTLNMYHYSHQPTDNHQRQPQQHISTNDLINQDQSCNNIAEPDEDNQQAAIQELTTSQFTQESGTNMIAHHDTIDNLYQPITSGDIDNENSSRVDDQPTSLAFPIACNYTNNSDVIRNNDDNDATGRDEDKNCLGETKTFNDLDDPNSTQNSTSVIISSNDSIDQNTSPQRLFNRYQDCHRDDLTNSSTYFNSDVAMRKPIKDIDPIGNDPTPSFDTGIIHDNMIHGVTIIQDQSSSLLSTSANSDGNSNSSSQSSTSSDDSLTTSRPNDSSEIITSSSLIDTSLNSMSDYHHSSHDSGVALFSPRSNKRSSSSIGLDDEMEIDHLGDLATISNQSSNPGSNMNHCKKLRKREVMD